LGVRLLGDSGPDLDGWLASGSTTVVKTNSARTVYRVELPHGVVFVKHCKINGLRAWLREVIRPPKARLEFEHALALGNRDIATVEPLAWGGPDSNRPGESFLVTRELPAAVPFVHFLERVLPSLPPAGRRVAQRAVARGLGEFAAKLHDRGVAHPDPHPGNLMVEFSPGGAPAFALIDLHGIRFGDPLDWRDSRDNLVLFNRWFQLRASRADRFRFWRAYRTSRATLAAASPLELRAGAKELEGQTLSSNLRFWVGREARCLGSNRYFRRIRRGEYRGHAVRDLPDGVIDAILDDPDRVLNQSGIRILKSSRTSTVGALALPAAGPVAPWILKRVNLRSRVEPIKNLLRSSQVLRSWVSGHALRDRQLPAPRPLAVFHRYRFGVPLEGYLLTEMVPDSTPLGEAGTRATERVARLLRRMHDRGVSHRDLKAANILLAGGREPTLIDLVGVRTRAQLSEEQRAKELARLNASFLNTPSITRTERLRFLFAYLAAGTHPRLNWKYWWELVSRATAIKVAKNRRNGRDLG
jgi:tRNA A-37 threonylcarbamoyl transferase component Bud32